MFKVITPGQFIRSRRRPPVAPVRDVRGFMPLCSPAVWLRSLAPPLWARPVHELQDLRRPLVLIFLPGNAVPAPPIERWLERLSRVCGHRRRTLAIVWQGIRRWDPPPPEQGDCVVLGVDPGGTISRWLVPTDRLCVIVLDRWRQERFRIEETRLPDSARLGALIASAMDDCHEPGAGA